MENNSVHNINLSFCFKKNTNEYGVLVKKSNDSWLQCTTKSVRHVETMDRKLIYVQYVVGPQYGNTEGKTKYEKNEKERRGCPTDTGNWYSTIVGEKYLYLWATINYC